MAVWTAHWRPNAIDKHSLSRSGQQRSCSNPCGRDPGGVKRCVVSPPSERVPASRLVEGSSLGTTHIGLVGQAVGSFKHFCGADVLDEN